MRGIHPFPQTDTEWRENLRTMTELHERKVLTFHRAPGDGVLLGAGAAFVYRAAGFITYTMLPNAATTAWGFSVPVDPAWQRAAVRWTSWYTSPVGSPNAFSAMEFGAAPWGNVGDNLGALADAFVVGRPWPAPAVAEDILTDVFVWGTAVVSTAKPWLAFRIMRLDPDANANELWILGTQVEILPL